MNILAFDTSTEACSVALSRGQDHYGEFDITPRAHTVFLPKMLDRVLATAGLDRTQIDYVAYSNGPGAFTGVRIAVSFAQGIALGLNKPLIAVSTLAVLAQLAADRLQHPRILAALDARMGEVYCGHYEVQASGLVALQGEERLLRLGELHLDGDEIGAGSGFVAARDGECEPGTASSIHPDLYPDARVLLKLAIDKARRQQTASLRDSPINYLRNRVAEKPSA